MTRRFVSLASLAGIAAVVAVTTAAVPHPRVATTEPRTKSTTVVSKVLTAKRGVVKVNVLEETVSIDWRVLADLDYSNGKWTDTLKKLDGKLVRIPPRRSMRVAARWRFSAP